MTQSLPLRNRKCSQRATRNVG